ncbi:uncharacterized protein LOC134528634 [Bacillus rossius redtenbacheri]|uniref:uncharacterized protein LOC134528634 n=1 Tax=Bacillus rossius redtenbacheri TaxID=93214 RepID=UPI002FDDD983
MPRWRRLLLALLAAAAWLSPALLPPPAVRDAPPPTVREPPSSPRVIVAYSLESRVQMEQRVPVPCSPPPPPPRAAPGWQQTARRAHLYSAHYDARLGAHHYVRVVAALEGRDNASALFCQLWFGRRPLVVEALEAELWVSAWDDDASYRPVLLSCPIPRERSALGDRPQGVSVVRRPCAAARTMLAVPEPPPPDRRLRNFAVCVKGLDFPREDISRRLVEWLELNRLLGADLFLVYVYSAHHNVRRVLDHYSRAGVVTQVPLRLPGRLPNSPAARSRYLRTHVWQRRRTEVVPYNDCLYRSLDSHRYVMPLDVDEVILPARARSWGDLLASLDPAVVRSHASLSARNAYFFDGFPPSRASLRYPPHFHVLRHTRRSANFSPAGEAVKSFVSTQRALTVFNHYALSALDPAVGRSHLLDSSLAQLNHYKAGCEPLLVRDCEDNFLRHHVEDTLVMRFADELVARVEPVLRELGLLPL